MKRLRKLLYFASGICLIVTCTKENFGPEALNYAVLKSTELNASELSLGWHGSTAGSDFRSEIVLTIRNEGNNARIRYIPEWISVEDNNSNPVSENDVVFDGEILLICPVCKNEGGKKCDAIEISDATGQKLQICVSQCGCNDNPIVSVGTFTEDPPSCMTISNALGYTIDGSASVAVRFTPKNPCYAPDVNFNADFYVYKNDVCVGSGQWILLNRLENNRILTMNEPGRAGDKIMVVIGEHRTGETEIAGDIVQ